jgi:hypothetical protein
MRIITPYEIVPNETISSPMSIDLFFPIRFKLWPIIGEAMKAAISKALL